MPDRVLLKAISGYNIDTASGKRMDVPVFGQKYWKKNYILTDKTKQNYDGVSHHNVLEYSYPDQNHLTSEKFDTSWISKVLDEFKGHMYTNPGESQSFQEIKTAPPIDSDVIGRLNLRHLLRGL